MHWEIFVFRTSKCVNEELTELNSKSVPPLLYCRCSWRYPERGTLPGGEHLTAHRVLTNRRRAGFTRHYTTHRMLRGKTKKKSPYLQQTSSKPWQWRFVLNYLHCPHGRSHSIDSQSCLLTKKKAVKNKTLCVCVEEHEMIKRFTLTTTILP